MSEPLSGDKSSRRVRDYELLRMNDGGEVKIWADGQIDILTKSHMTIGFQNAKERQAPPPPTAPQVPRDDEIRLAMGELTADQMRTAKAAIRWVLSRQRTDYHFM